MVFRESLKQYVQNYKTALGFALLLVFVLFFVLSQNFFVSSGSIFADFNIIKSGAIDAVLALLAIAVFEFFYAILITLVVFAVRNNMSKVRVQYYLSEKIQKFSFKLFIFFFAFTLAALALQSFLPLVGIPIAAVNLLLLIASLLLIFFPQAVVIDESGIRSSIIASAEFLMSHLKESAQIIIAGALMLIALGIFEFALDQFFFAGNFITPLISLVFIIPFLEIVKSVIYLHKFELVKSVNREIKPKAAPASVNAN
ncbi:MAG: hypothetical protein ABID38_00970 [Candidatus Diapherotrites archaeon]